MVRPQAAIVGSVDESRVFDPPVSDAAGARRACEELGRELAVAEWDLVVYSAKPRFIEADVVRGYVGSGKAAAASIRVHAPIGKGSFAEYAEQPDVFDARPDPSRDWEVSFYRSLSGCDGVILLGGGRSTLITGLIALTMRLPLLAVAAFGGNARKVWERLSNETGQSDADRDEMGKTWEGGSAARLVQALERQRQERLERERAAARRERTEARRANTSLAVAVVLLLAAVAGLVLSWGSRPGSAGSIALLALVPMLAAAGGALIRTSLDVGRDWMRAGVLGGAAGLITGLLYVASQLVASPTVLDPGQTTAVRRLLFFVLPIGFVAGLTFDAVYAKLRGSNVSQAATLGKL
jgi:hypothetical protein